MYSSIPFGHEGGMWDLIVLIPDHCHSKEGPLYFPPVQEALLYIVCLFLYLERFYLHVILFLLFPVSDI